MSLSKNTTMCASLASSYSKKDTLEHGRTTKRLEAANIASSGANAYR